MTRIDILQKFYDWLRFYRETGLEYIDETSHTEALRKALSPEKAPKAKQPHAKPAARKMPGPAPSSMKNRTHSRSPSFTSTASAQKRENTKGNAVRKLLKELSEDTCSPCPAAEDGLGPVHGAGPENARLLVVCDMPVREDVRGGIPFQGEAGNMLTRMLRAIRIERSDVFLTCAIKCIAAGRENKKKEITERCGKLLLKEIELIKPSFILSLGAEAARIILENSGSLNSFMNSEGKTDVSEFRSRVILLEESGISMVVTHSPVSMLKLKGDILKKQKMEAWHDLQLLEKIYHN